MSVRPAAVAGQFYEADGPTCALHIEQMLAQVQLPPDLPPNITGGIVPHAGWVFSGSLALLTLAAIKKQEHAVDTFVVFGAVHRANQPLAMLYDAGQWDTPLGPVDVDEHLARKALAQAADLMLVDTDAHTQEHSIEVQVPLIAHLFPEAKIVPVLTPPTPQAPLVGQAVARAVAAAPNKVICIGSTDLTHYGPSYMFTPHGTGQEGIDWAKRENDRFFIDLVLSMQAEKIVESAEMYRNACGAGAVAATVAAAKDMGAASGRLLAHTTSAEVIAERFGRGSDDSVGYAAIIFGR